MPRWNTVSISGYHIREAGSTAVQELAFTIADGMAYVEAALARGLAVDDFAPRLSFFFNSHTDFFEEIAKFRASRRIWWKLMTERYRAPGRALDVDALPHADGRRLAHPAAAAQQPDPRRDPGPGRGPRRGTQSLHTDAYDEALAVPTEAAALLALRQQQVIAEETGVAGTVDPLGGSWFVEALTNETEREVWRYLDEIDAWAAWCTRSRPATRSGRSPTPPTATSASSRPGSGSSSASTATRTRTNGAAVPVLQVPEARWDASSPGSRGRRRERDHGGGRRRRSAALRDAASRPGVDRHEPDAALHPLRRGVRYPRRAVRGPPRGLRGVPRAGRDLTNPARGRPRPQPGIIAAHGGSHHVPP